MAGSAEHQQLSTLGPQMGDLPRHGDKYQLAENGFAPSTQIVLRAGLKATLWRTVLLCYQN